METAKTIIHAKNVYKNYRSGKNEIHVINDINLELKAGEFTIIMGSSGSGKSTLLYLLSGLEPPTSGEIWLEDKPVHSLSLIHI